MGSKVSSSFALFFFIYLLLSVFVSARSCCSTDPRPCPSPPTSPYPTPTPTPSARGRCPRDALKLGVCANVLNGLVNATVGTPPVAPCCTLIQGLADLEAAVCLCTSIKANILGLNLNIPLSLSLLLNICGNTVPRGFQCS